jgi:hypothetical protein
MSHCAVGEQRGDRKTSRDKVRLKITLDPRYRPFQTRASVTGKRTGVIGRRCISPAGTSCCIGDAPSLHPQPPLIQRDSQTESPDPPWPYLSHSLLPATFSTLLSSASVATANHPFSLPPRRRVTRFLHFGWCPDSLLPDSTTTKKLAIPSNQFSSTSAPCGPHNR